MKTAFKDIQIVSRLGADERTLAFDVLDGLTRPFKEIPPKHFYDTEGSRLFEAITKLPEYYPTRTERAILETHAADIVEMTGMNSSASSRSMMCGFTDVMSPTNPSSGSRGVARMSPASAPDRPTA